MEIIFIFALLVCVAVISWHVASENDISTSLLAFLFIEHLIAMQFFRLFSPENQSDWIYYFYEGQRHATNHSGFEYVSPGLQFIVAINHILQTIGPFSTLGMFLAFTLCGYLGHVFFLAACRRFLTLPRDSLWLLLFFLPGLHIWTCSLGKDSLIFLPLCYVLYAVSRSRYPIVPLCGAAALVFMIRPHVMLFLVAAGFLASVFSKGVESIHLKIGKVVATAIVLVLTFPTVQNYVGLKEVSMESVTAKMEAGARGNQTGGGAVQLESLSPPARLATYLFRPLFYDVRNLMGWFASIENALLLAMFVLFTYQGIIPWIFSRPSFSVVFAVFFVMIMWIMNGMITANLGLALRQKMQFVPYIFYVFLAFRWSRENPEVQSLS